jgi:hypothetical protein
MEALVVEAGISVLDPGGANEVGIDFGRRRSRGVRARAIATVNEDNILQVLVTQGIITESMIHGLKEFGLTIEIDQSNNLLELIKGMEFGFCQGLNITASRLSQGEYGVAVFEVSGLGFGREQAFVVAGVFDALILLEGARVLGDELVLVIDRDELIIRFQGEHSGGIGKGDTVAVGFELDERLRSTLDRGGDPDIVIPLRQRDETRLLIPEEQIDGFLFGGAMDAAIGHLVSPGQSLSVDIGQGEEGPSCKKILFNVLDTSFHASFLMG